MNKRLYVGNLDYATEGKDLEELFASEGKVVYAKVITDPNGRSRGFGFVEMETEQEAQKALEKFNKYRFRDRTLFVSEARVVDRPQGDRFKGKEDLNFKLKKLRGKSY